MINFLVSQVGSCGRCTTCSDDDRHKNDELLFDVKAADGAIPDRPLLLGLQHICAVSHGPVGPGFGDFDGEEDVECEGTGGLISARSAASETRAEMIHRLRSEAEERDRALRELRPKSKVTQHVPPLALPTSNGGQNVPPLALPASEYYQAPAGYLTPPTPSSCRTFSHQQSLDVHMLCEEGVAQDNAVHETEKPAIVCEKVPISERSTVDHGSEDPSCRSVSEMMGSSAASQPFESEQQGSYGSERPSLRSGHQSQGSHQSHKKPTLLGSQQQADRAFAKELLEKRQAQAQERAAQTRRHHKLRSFLASAGFREGVNSRKPIRKGLLSLGFSYPLHAAVRANDADAIEVLLWAGADRSLADSEGLTPLALAQRLDKGDSHRKAVICLSS